MFVLRQINSKINTVFISMSFICLLLFTGICMLAGGLGISSALNSDLKDLTQHDLTIINYDGVNIEEYFKEKGLVLGDYSDDYVSYINYKSDLKYNDIIKEEDRKELKDLYPIATNSEVQIISLSKFNELMKMANKEEISLNPGEYAIFSDIKEANKALNTAIKEEKEININENILKPSDNKVIELVAYNDIMKNNICTIIVNDNIVSDLTHYTSYVNMNYKNDDSKIIIAKIEEVNKRSGDTYFVSNDKESLFASSSSMGATISYLGIYMGGIFLITSAAVLALQQLSESTNNIARYNLLKKIGVDEKLINKSLLIQIAIYFLMPLSLALIHSIAGLEFSKRIITLFGSISIMKNILISLAVLVIIYGGYFIATYFGAKKNINNSI